MAQEGGMVLRRTAVAIGAVALCVLTACQPTSPPASPTAQQDVHQDALPADALDLAGLAPVTPKGGHLDHSGRKQKGRVSYYARRFANRKMADGSHFSPDSNIAASKTLPLGTTAKVTNLANGRSATVVVGDRGPFVDGRVVDVTPNVADQLEIRKSGVAPVVVAPIAVPQVDGGMKLGAGAVEASPQEVERATREAAAAGH
jgi:rare lipoprotein A